MEKRAPLSAAERAARRRAALRAQGLRRKEFWVPDVRTAEFKAQARRAALALAKAEDDSDDRAFAEAVQYWPDDD